MLIGFKPPSEQVSSEIWKRCVFVFDANFVLNLYRYEASAREEFLNVFFSIKDRVWLPHYAALEFERNRPKVIAEQLKKFSDVRRIVGKTASHLEGEFGNLQIKKRHSLINIDKLVEEIRASTERFLKQLSDLESSQINVHQDFDIRNKVEELFFDNIGQAPSAEWMKNLVKEGDIRYQNKFPPGYCDVGKGKEADPTFLYGGVLYERKYGDLIIWKQIIEYSALAERKDIVFLTDDTKEDWWWIINSSGEKRLGPRPELVDEITRLGQIESFYVYGPEQFLQYAKKYLDSEVSQQTIEQARDISDLSIDDLPSIYPTARVAVNSWIDTKFKNFSFVDSQSIYPDYVILNNDNMRRIGIEYIPVESAKANISYIESLIQSLEEAISAEKLDEMYLLIVYESENDMPKSLESRLRQEFADISGDFEVIVGIARQTGSDTSSYEFEEKFDIMPSR